MQEYYKNEKNNDEPQWGGAGGGGTGGGGAGGGGASWGESDTEPKPEFVDPEIIDRLKPQADISSLRSSAHGLLLADADGMLLDCSQLCGEVPAILAVIETEEEYESLRDSHARCIQINLEYSQLKPLILSPEKNLEYELWPIDRTMALSLLPDKSEPIHYSGYFPLPEPGERLTIKVAWQKGHFDINQLSLMKFRIFNVNCGTKSIGTNWRTIATVTVDELYHITVNGLSGELPGGKRNYHAN